MARRFLSRARARELWLVGTSRLLEERAGLDKKGRQFTCHFKVRRESKLFETVGGSPYTGCSSPFHRRSYASGKLDMRRRYRDDFFNNYAPAGLRGLAYSTFCIIQPSDFMRTENCKRTVRICQTRNVAGKRIPVSLCDFPIRNGKGENCPEAL